MLKQSTIIHKLGITLLLVSIVLLSACKELEQAQNNLAKWTNSEISNYEYTFKKDICANAQDPCAVKLSASYTVRVIDNEVVYAASNGFPVDQDLTDFYTITQVLENIKTDIENDRIRDTQYDKAYGYPIKSVMPKTNAQAFSNFAINELRVLSQVDELLEKSQAWNQYLEDEPSLAYTLSYDTICFCLPASYVVEVVDQNIRSVTVNGETIDISQGKTIKDLFADTLKNYKNNYRTDISFQSTKLGLDVPSSISTDLEEFLADDVFGYSDIKVEVAQGKTNFEIAQQKWQALNIKNYNMSYEINLKTPIKGVTDKFGFRFTTRLYVATVNVRNNEIESYTQDYFANSSIKLFNKILDEIYSINNPDSEPGPPDIFEFVLSKLLFTVDDMFSPFPESTEADVDILASLEDNDKGPYDLITAFEFDFNSQYYYLEHMNLSINSVYSNPNNEPNLNTDVIFKITDFEVIE